MNFTSQESENDSANCTMHFDEPAFTNVAIINLILAIVSFISSVFVIAFILLTKKRKFFSERLILYWTIAAMLFSFALVINRLDIKREESTFLTEWCVLSGAMIQITSWMAFLAITGLTIYLFCRTALKWNTEKFEWAYIVLIFIVPLLFNWIPFIGKTYGRSGIWCWIRSFDYDDCNIIVFGIRLQFSLLYVPRYILLTLIFILYIIIIIKIQLARRAQRHDHHIKKLTNKMIAEVLTLVAYPFIYCILLIPLLINQLYNSFVKPSEPSLYLWYLSGISLPLHGFFAAIIYTFVTACKQRESAWTKLRVTILRRSMKVKEYPMKTNAISDSIFVNTALSTDKHKNVDYTSYL